MFGGFPKTISNTNELLGNYDGIYGVKTGFTFNAGRCLVTACKRNNLDIIVVVLGADNKKNRSIDSIKVLNYVFNNFNAIDISNIIYEEFDKYKSYFSKNSIIEKSTDKPVIELSTLDNTVFPLKRSELNSISSEIYSLTKISTPSYQNKKIGQVTLKVDDEILLTSSIMIKNNLNRKTWKIYYYELLKNFFNV